MFTSYWGGELRARIDNMALIRITFPIILTLVFLWLGYFLRPKGEPPEKIEMSDYELMMNILRLERNSITLEKIRDLFASKEKPTKRYVRKRLKKLVQAGTLTKIGRNQYTPIKKEDYLLRVITNLLEKDGYTVLEHLK
jgi:hypothetical protein